MQWLKQYLAVKSDGYILGQLELLLGEPWMPGRAQLAARPARPSGVNDQGTELPWPKDEPAPAMFVRRRSGLGFDQLSLRGAGTTVVVFVVFIAFSVWWWGAGSCAGKAQKMGKPAPATRSGLTLITSPAPLTDNPGDVLFRIEVGNTGRLGDVSSVAIFPGPTYVPCHLVYDGNRDGSLGSFDVLECAEDISHDHFGVSSRGKPYEVRLFPQGSTPFTLGWTPLEESP